VGVLLIVLIVELLNSALEALADTITVDPHPMIGRAKDLGSAAVLLSLVVAALVWVGVLASHLLPA
jgi:diacylglycerol kinase (ATP)